MGVISHFTDKGIEARVLEIPRTSTPVGLLFCQAIPYVGETSDNIV